MRLDHISITFLLADSLPCELLDDWLRASSSLKLRRTGRDAFLAVNPPQWDDLTEACYHGPFSDKLDEHLDTAHAPAPRGIISSLQGGHEM